MNAPCRIMKTAHPYVMNVEADGWICGGPLLLPHWVYSDANVHLWLRDHGDQMLADYRARRIVIVRRADGAKVAEWPEVTE